MIHLWRFSSGPRAVLPQKLLNEVPAARVCLVDSQAKRSYDNQLRGQTSGPDEGTLSGAACRQARNDGQRRQILTNL
jgi:hypothetical protein